MTNAQTVMAQVLLRHHASGHVRFSLPDELCLPGIVQYLEQGMHQLEGVRRVAVYSSQRKLSIFFQETVCDLHDVVRKLGRLIELLVERGWVTPAPAAGRPGLIQRLRNARPFRRVRDRYRAWKGRKSGLLAMAKAQWDANPVLRLIGNDPEKALIAFANDLVTFYLIKVHWNLIISKWLKRPVKHRYEWLTAFYLVLLLVRSRKR